ncbi:hypothetical protein LTR84_005941 [Exophiala bonariae]|uniref:Uncharacterized protein n=1 Tax=Exophiala bonariae TaxID=1690606 RepID=A0AAV9N4M5_9EURO|nr:hypothetical protein LTR84_005941 [Exophiala bonariae]
MASYNGHWARWMPSTPEVSAGPELGPEAPAAPESTAKAPAALARAVEPEPDQPTPVNPPAALAAAAEPEPGQQTPVNPPDAYLFPLPTFSAHLAAQQGRTMRDIANSSAGSSIRHAIRPMTVVGQTHAERDLSKLHRFCEKLRDEQLLFKKVLEDILAETHDLNTTIQELLAAVDEDAIHKTVKTAVGNSTKDLNARVVAAVANAVQLSSTSASSEKPSKSIDSKTNSVKYEAKIKSLEAANQQSNAKNKSLEATIQQSEAKHNEATARSQKELTASHQTLKATQGQLNVVRESLVLQDASFEAKQNEWNQIFALKAAEVVSARETAEKMGQVLEETKSALAMTTADLEPANKSLDALKESATCNSASEIEATKASNAILEAQLLESQGREASLAENARNLEQANEALRNQVEELMAPKQESNSAPNDGSAQLQYLQNSLELSNKEIADLQKVNSTLMTEGQALLEQRNELDTRCQAAQKERDEFFKGGHALQNRLSAADEDIKGIDKVCREQAVQIGKLQQELIGSHKRCETFGTQAADLQEKLQLARAAGAQAVALAAQEKEAKIARLEARLQANQNNVVATPSTPFPKAQHAHLFSPGPRDKPHSPNAAKAAFAVFEKEKGALKEHIRTLTTQLENVTRERDVLLEKAENHQMEIALFEQGAQNDSSEFRALDVAKTRADQDKEELQHKLEIANMVVAAQRSVLENDQAVNPQKENLKRVASVELENEQGITKVRRMAACFDTVFPHGYNRIQTSGEGLLCGIRALVSSMQAQHPNTEPVTFDQLYQMLHDTDYRGLVGQFGPMSENNFRADELALMIHLFYSLYDLNVHLGIVQPGQEPLLIPGEDSERLDRITVWIYNDRARESAAAQGINPDAPGHIIYNHYEGLQPTQAPESQLLLQQAPSDGVPTRAAPGSRNIANARGRTARLRSPTKPRMQANNPFAALFKPGPMQTGGTGEED